jgi:LPS export ABC transporter permease LptG
VTSAARQALHGPRRPGASFNLYVAREALLPALFGLFGLTAVVLTASLIDLSDLFFNRSVSGGVVVRLLFYESFPVMTRMLPFAVLMGCLVALGRLAADLEILALEASGVAPIRLVWPLVLLAAALSCAGLLFSVELTPWAGRRFDATLAGVARSTPWAHLESGKRTGFGGWQLEAREVSPAGNQLDSVMLWVPDLGETVFARGGALETNGEGTVEITLQDGRLVLPSDAAAGRAAQISFRQAVTLLPEGSTGLAREDEDRIPSLPLEELIQRAEEFVPGPLNRPRAAIELQRRFAYPAATLVFGLLAVPLFLARRNLSRSSGGVLALALTLLYYGLTELGEGLIVAGTLSPAGGAWLANGVLAGIAALLLLRSLRDRSLTRAPARMRSSSRAQASGGASRKPRRYALPRYVGRRALQLLALSFGILFVAYFLIDLMDRLSWFSKHEASGVEILRFYAGRIWLLASRAVPMAILIGTALTVSLLAAEGELLGMRSCGIPAPRALLPSLLIAALIAPAYFALNNVVLPHSNALADYIKETEIKGEHYRKRREKRKAGYRKRSGDQLIEAELFDPDMGQARGITIFDLGEYGLPTGRTDAARGRHIGQGWWRLTAPARVDMREGGIQLVAAPRHALLGDTVDAGLDTDHMSAREIALEIDAVEADGFDAADFRVEFHKRLAEPLACLVLPAIVLFFAAGGPPFPTPAQTLLVSAVIGVSYVLVVAVGTSLGSGGTVPPALGAWGPIALFALLAIGAAVRLLRRI